MPKRPPPDDDQDRDPQGATRYDRAMEALDRLLFADGRRWVCRPGVWRRARSGCRLRAESAVLRGRRSDHGAGHQPRDAGTAPERAAAIGRRVDLHVGDAQALACPNDRFDTVVCTLGLCTIPDERRALQEMWRVLRPGGRLLLCEHVRSPRRAIRLVQHVLDPIAYLLASDHWLRDPLPLVQQIGFEIDRVERHAFGVLEYLAARKPSRTPATVGTHEAANAGP